MKIKDWSWQEVFDKKTLVCLSCSRGIMKYAEESMHCEICSAVVKLKKDVVKKGVWDMIFSLHENDYNAIDNAWVQSFFRFEEAHFWPILRNGFILKLMKRYLSRGASFLDIGCGLGKIVSVLRNNGFKAMGVEGDLRLVEEAVNRRNVPVLRMNALHTGFINSFDAVGLFDVIEHLDDDKQALCEAMQTVKKNGLIFITVPAFPFLWSASDAAGGHKRRYRKKDLKALERISGLKLIKCGYFMMYLTPLMLISRLIQRNVPVEEAVLKQHRQEMDIGFVSNFFLKAVGKLECLFWKWGMPAGTSLFAVFQVTSGTCNSSDYKPGVFAVTGKKDDINNRDVLELEKGPNDIGEI